MGTDRSFLETFFHEQPEEVENILISFAELEEAARNSFNDKKAFAKVFREILKGEDKLEAHLLSYLRKIERDIHWYVLQYFSPHFRDRIEALSGYFGEGEFCRKLEKWFYDELEKERHKTRASTISLFKIAYEHEPGMQMWLPKSFSIDFVNANSSRDEHHHLFLHFDIPRCSENIIHNCIEELKNNGFAKVDLIISKYTRQYCKSIGDEVLAEAAHKLVSALGKDYASLGTDESYAKLFLFVQLLSPKVCHIYYFTIPVQHEYSGPALLVATCDELKPEKAFAVYSLVSLITSIGEFTESNLAKILIESHARKAAVAEIINRDYAHHIGSHVSPRATIDKVLHRLGKRIDDLTDKTLAATIGQMLNTLDRYKDERNEFIANLTNDPIYTPNDFYREVILPFVENKLLIDNIAANEGIDYKNKSPRLNSNIQGGREALATDTTTQSQLVVRVFINKSLCKNGGQCLDHPETRNLTPLPHDFIELKACYYKNVNGVGEFQYDSLSLPYYRKVENIGDSFFDDRTLSCDDICVSLPGSLGKHALYSILENYIRNTAKHSYKRDKHNNKPVEIIIRISPKDEVSYRLELTDNISNVGNEEVQKLKDMIEKTDIIEKKHLGIAAMKINACLLAGKDLTEENMKAALTVGKDGANHLVYKFSVLKQRDVALIGCFETLNDENAGIYYFENLEQYLKTAVKNFRFAIIDCTSIDIKTIRQHHHQLPFRLLLLGTNGQECELLRSRRAACIHNGALSVSKDRLLEYCWQEWLKRFEESNIDVRVFFEQDNTARPTNKWIEACKSIQKGPIESSVCYINFAGGIHSIDSTGKNTPIGELDDSSKFYILYDRHAKLSGWLKRKLLQKNFYEQIDKNSADFDLLFNANTDQRPFLFLNELVEAGLMKILILDERVAELSTELIQDPNGHYNVINKRGFGKFKTGYAPSDNSSSSTFTRFDACWAARIYIGTHISPDSDDKLLTPLKEEIDPKTNHFLKIKFVQQENNLIKIKAETNFVEWDEKEWSVLDNGWKSQQSEDILKDVPIQTHESFPVDCIIIHRTKLKELHEYWTRKGIDFLQSLDVPRIIVTTGGGIVDFIDTTKWRVLPTNVIKDYVLGSRPAKLSLIKRIIN